MATRSIVPRATGEGGIGTAAKKWLAAYLDHIYAPVYEYIRIPAGQFKTATASSSQFGTDELTYIVQTRFRFTAGGSYVTLARADLPYDWNEGNLRMRMKWKTDDANLNGVSLPVYGVLLGDGESDDVDITTLLTTITDTNTGAGKQNVSAWTSTFTIGSPTGKRALIMKLARGTDALASYLDLLEVEIECIRQLAY